MFSVLAGLLVVTLGLLYWYLTARFSYWRDKRVPYDPPRPLVGSMGGVLTLREHMSQFYQRLYHKFDGHKFAGYFQGRTPCLLIRDPALVKNIMISDFHHFMDHGYVIDEVSDPLQGKNLFNMEGARWREMRGNLTPMFTAHRMKAMFPLVLEIAQHLEQHLAKLADTNQHIDIKDVLGRYTTDVMSSSVFGIKGNSIDIPDDILRVMGRKVLDIGVIQALKQATLFFAPEIGRRLGFTFLGSELDKFFTDLVLSAMSQRSGGERQDFMQLMLQLREDSVTDPHQGGAEVTGTADGHKPSRWTDIDVIAQVVVFFVTGFETSSSALTFALYELARRPELQRKAREHIEEVLARHGDHVTYQALQDMTYLDWILSESLRKYPVLSVLNRVCTKPYTLPGTSVTLDVGTLVDIPIYAFQHDPSLFPEPERFHPERFSEGNWNPTLQYVYMPFGEGPRQCIGLRFARMQSKLGLVSLLRQFEVRPSARTPYPLSFDPKQFVLTSKVKVCIKLMKVQI